MALRFDGPVVIVCEGPADARLVRRLIEREHLTGCFAHEAMGYQHFGRAVTVIATSTDRPMLRRLAIIVDNDINPQARWVNACNALQAENLAVPTVHGEIVNGDPSTAVFMVPAFGVHGAIETLLVRALLEARPEVEACLQQLETCPTGCAEWDVVKRSKMRFQAAIAITCQDDPSSGAAHIWTKTHNPIQATSTAFDELAGFLRAIATF